MKDLNNYISKRHQNMVVKFNKDLEAFAKQTEEEESTLYEDAFTHFTLSNVRLEDGCLCYKYDGKEERDEIVQWDEYSQEWYESEVYSMDLPETIKFWRSCLRRAKRYWDTDSDTLDKMSEGEIEDLD